MEVPGPGALQQEAARPCHRPTEAGRAPRGASLQEVTCPCQRRLQEAVGRLQPHALKPAVRNGACRAPPLPAALPDRASHLSLVLAAPLAPLPCWSRPCDANLGFGYGRRHGCTKGRERNHGFEFLPCFSDRGFQTVADWSDKDAPIFSGDL